MTVGRDYLLKKPAGPSAPKLFLDTRIVPMVANLAGGVEVALDRAAVRTGVRPSVILACATGLAALALFRLRAPAVRASGRGGRGRPTPSAAS